MNIDLAGEPIDPDVTVGCGWWYDANRVTVRDATILATYNLPRGARRIVVHRLGCGRSQLVIAKMTSVTVTVTGPTEHIHKLREAVL